MARARSSSHHAQGQSVHYAYPPPLATPRGKNSRCSLPPISNLLWMADQGSPTTETSPASRESRNFLPNSTNDPSSAVTRTALPPTPPIYSEAPLEGCYPPSARSVSQMSSSPRYHFETTPSSGPMEAETRQIAVPQIPMQSPADARSYAPSPYMAPPAVNAPCRMNQMTPPIQRTPPPPPSDYAPLSAPSQYMAPPAVSTSCPIVQMTAPIQRTSLSPPSDYAPSFAPSQYMAPPAVSTSCPMIQMTAPIQRTLPSPPSDYAPSSASSQYIAPPAVSTSYPMIRITAPIQRTPPSPPSDYAPLSAPLQNMAPPHAVDHPYPMIRMTAPIQRTPSKPSAYAPSSAPSPNMAPPAANASFPFIHMTPPFRRTSHAPPSTSGMYNQGPLPQQGFPLPVPITIGRASGPIEWQFYHFVAPSTAGNCYRWRERFVCQRCNKAFSRPSSLRVHSLSHSGEKPWNCPHAGCNRSFSVRSNMRRHKKFCHHAKPKHGSVALWLA